MRPARDFLEHVRDALAPLIADPALRERVALKIQRGQASNWKFREDSGFFDFERKVDRVVAHFAPDGLTRPDFLRAAVQRVPLFFQNPETLIRNIERVVKHFRKDGLTYAQYLRAAALQPALFYRKPETIIRRVTQIIGLHRKGLLALRPRPDLSQTDAARILEIMVRHPSLFSMSEENIALRETYARLTHARSVKAVLYKARHRIERELEERRGQREPI